MANEARNPWGYRLELVRRREAVPVVSPSEVLREVVELLEDYGPSWYTQETRDRAMAALSAANMQGERPPTSA